VPKEREGGWGGGGGGSPVKAKKDVQLKQDEKYYDKNTNYFGT